MEKSGYDDDDIDVNANVKAVATLSKAKHTAKELAFFMRKLTVEEIFTDLNVINKRQKMLTVCAKLMENVQFRREALEMIWFNCFYEPIRAYKSVGELDDEDRALLKRFISKCVSEVSKLLNSYEDMQPMLLLYLGDLYRYSFTLCGYDSRDAQIAEQCYKKASKLDFANCGRPLNQLALLFKEREPETAVTLLLRSLTISRPYTQAAKNLEAISSENFESAEKSAMHGLVDSMLFNYNRTSFDGARKQFDAVIAELINRSEHTAVIGFVHIISLAIRYILSNEDNSERFRSSLSLLYQKWTPLCECMKQRVTECNRREEEEHMMKRRRRRKRESSSSNSSDDDDDRKREETVPSNGDKGSALDDVFGLVTSIAEFLGEAGEQLASKRQSVSLKLQYQNLLKTFVDLLNELLGQLVPLMGKGNFTPPPSSVLLDWLMYGPAMASKSHYPNLATHFLRKCVECDKFAFTSDGFFQLGGSPNGSRDLHAMETFSKVHSQHIAEMYEKTSKIPVYIVPDYHLFVSGLSLIEQMMASNRQTVIIARNVLARLDKVKKENAQAREAIRWIQESIPKGRVRMLAHTGERFIGECKKYMEEKGVLDKQTLFLSILTTEEGKQEYEDANSSAEVQQYPALAIEEVHEFMSRINQGSTSID